MNKGKIKPINSQNKNLKNLHCPLIFIGSVIRLKINYLVGKNEINNGKIKPISNQYIYNKNIFISIMLGYKNSNGDEDGVVTIYI